MFGPQRDFWERPGGSGLYASKNLPRSVSPAAARFRAVGGPPMRWLTNKTLTRTPYRR